MPKQPKPFRNPQQPDKLFGHSCKVEFFDDSKKIEITFNTIKVSEVPFKESDLPLTPEESTFSYSNKNWMIFSVDTSDIENIGNGHYYRNYKIIAIDKNSYLR